MRKRHTEWVHKVLESKRKRRRGSATAAEKYAIGPRGKLGSSTSVNDAAAAFSRRNVLTRGRSTNGNAGGGAHAGDAGSDTSSEGSGSHSQGPPVAKPRGSAPPGDDGFHSLTDMGTHEPAQASRPTRRRPRAPASTGVDGGSPTRPHGGVRQPEAHTRVAGGMSPANGVNAVSHRQRGGATSRPLPAPAATRSPPRSRGTGVGSPAPAPRAAGRATAPTSRGEAQAPKLPSASPTPGRATVTRRSRPSGEAKLPTAQARRGGGAVPTAVARSQRVRQLPPPTHSPHSRGRHERTARRALRQAPRSAPASRGPANQSTGSDGFAIGVANDAFSAELARWSQGSGQ